MAAKKKRTKPAPPLDSATNSLLGTLLTCIVGLLLVVRMLVPTESAEEGRTLWIVQFWLAAGLLWAWNSFRERDHRIRWSRLDFAFWVVVLGHVISALAVFVAGGQKRAAVNLAWEWVGLGVCFFLLRQTIRTAADARRLVGIMVAVTVSLSGLGLWQHYVFYPTIRQEYKHNKAELQKLTDMPPAASNDEQFRQMKKRRELQAWMFNAGIPRDAAAAALFEDRLNSSEPFGMFALANTFAGVLLVWFLASTEMFLAAAREHRRWSRWLIPTLAVGLIGYCLILTKSRTAWVGLLAGCAVWGMARLWQSGTASAKWVAYTAGGLTLLAAMLAFAAMSGGFDIEVLTEAPKSLRYRLQYWTASWQMLCDQPIFGSGPGNFRHHYLQYKLPASSEEIADPHNFLLDVWANGGLVALIGLLAFLYFAVRPIRLIANEKKDSSATTTTKRKLSHPLAVGSLLAFIAVFAITFLSGEGYDLRLVALFGGTVAVIFFCDPISNRAGTSVVCLVAALCSLLIHLLGAGGIEMPAIVQTLLVLVVAIDVWKQNSSAEFQSTRQLPHGALFGGGLFGVLFVICLMSATAPALNRRALLSMGDAAVATGQGTAKADSLYQQAAGADPLSPAPLLQLAQLYHSNWSALPGDRSRDFNKAVGLQKLAIERDPYSAGNHRTLGQWYLQRYRRSGQAEDLASAVTSLRQAVARYPHNAAIRADLAIALDMSGQSEDAATEANRALRQNSINQSEGHRDKFLESEIVETLQKLTRRKASGP